MSLEQAIQFVPSFVLVFFRLAGMMLTTPLFGSARIPRRLKVMLALVMTVGMMPGVAPPVQMPATSWEMTLGIAGELVFGLAIGMAVSLVFVAVNWAGDVIGQQMGLGIGAALDPQFGQSSSVVGDFYFFLALVIFLIINGHHALLRGVHTTFQTLPLLSIRMDFGLLDMIVGLLHGATALCIKLAAPILITMLAVDVVLGFLGKTLPQINVMSAGLPLRAMAGIAIIRLGIVATSNVIEYELLSTFEQVNHAFDGTT